MTLSHARHCSHDLARGAVAALERVMIDESLLHWMQRTALLSEALDGGHRSAICLGRHGEAGRDAAAVEVDGARATLPMIATFLRTSQPELLANKVEQGHTGVGPQHFLPPVHENAECD